MRILALDTATAACSVALWRDGRILARRQAMMARGQSEAVMPMVAEVLAEAGRGFADLDLLAVTVGPGAFTGLRIGLAAARGMALAARLPCHGVTTLEAVAEGLAGDAPTGTAVLVALDAKRADVYAQAFSDSLVPLGPPRALLPDKLAELVPAGPVIVVGDAAPRAHAALRDAGIGAVASAAPGVPDAAAVAAIAARRWRPGDPAAPPSPLYLRPPDVTPAANAGRLRP